MTAAATPLPLCRTILHSATPAESVTVSSTGMSRSGGAYRDKSKALGLWIVLCHTPCHQGRTGAHGDPAVNEEYRKVAQRRSMEVYGWTTADFIREFGKNHL